MNLELLQQQLGYRFARVELLQEAVTHASMIRQNGPSEGFASYERLEFLGDAVLGLVAAEYLMQALHDATEGQMSRARARIVCEENLAAATRRMDIGDFLLVSAGEDKAGGRNRDALLADVFESIIAAIFLDGGFDEARQFIHKNLLIRESGVLELQASVDYKTTLQEFLQGMKLAAPTYEVVAMNGPSHAPQFTVSVLSQGREIGRGEGRSKKEASQLAAMHAIAGISSHAKAVGREK